MRGRGASTNAVLERLRAILRAYPADVELSAGQVVVRVGPDSLVDLLDRLGNDAQLGLTRLVDLTAIDRPSEASRFELVYQLASPEHGHRARVRVALGAGDAAVPSVTPLHPEADWLECEVYDQFGLAFEGHPELRRILHPNDFVGHPLRKDASVVDPRPTEPVS